MNPLKMILPVNRVEESINLRQDWNILWLDKVKHVLSRGRTIKLQELMNAESSPIAEVNLLLDDLSKGNLTTLKPLLNTRGYPIEM